MWWDRTSYLPGWNIHTIRIGTCHMKNRGAAKKYAMKGEERQESRREEKEERKASRQEKG